MRRSLAPWIGILALGLACSGCSRGPQTGTPGLEPPSSRHADAGPEQGVVGTAGTGTSGTGGTAAAIGFGGSMSNKGGSAGAGGSSGSAAPSADGGGALADQDAGALEP